MDCGGKRPWFYQLGLSPQCGAFGRELLDEKSQVAAIPWGLEEPWLQK